jgi:hypothetical protein
MTATVTRPVVLLFPEHPLIRIPVYLWRIYFTRTESLPRKRVHLHLLLASWKHWAFYWKLSCLLSRTEFNSLNLYMSMIDIRTTCFNVLKLCILPIEPVYVFRMVLTINRDCFPKQH